MPEYQAYPFRYVLTKIADDNADFDLVSVRVDSKRKWRVEHLACRFVDSTTGAIQVLIGGNGQEYMVVEQRSPSSDTLYWYDEPIELGEGDWLIARFIETKAANVLSFYYKGVELRRIS